jgi:hypothetical protein
MFNPPQRRYKKDPLVGAYIDGYFAAKKKKPLEENPYKPSGHERDTTFDDERHYQWYRGWMDFEE